MPHGPSNPGPHPSRICSFGNRISHADCPGYWRPFVIFAETPCTCSCHKPPPTVGPKGGSGTSVPEQVDARTRALADWYSGNLALSPTEVAESYRDLFLNESAFKPGPGRPVTISDEPETAKLMGWIDEGPQFIRGEGLQGPDQMVDLADPEGWRVPPPVDWNTMKPIDYGIPDVPRGLDPSARRLPAAHESAYVIRGDGVVDDMCELPDEMRNEVLVTGRAYGKKTVADQWRRQKLDALAGWNEGLIVTIVSRAVYELAKRSLDEREVQVARAIQAGKGLAIIRGKTQLTNLQGVPLVDGDIIREDCVAKFRLVDEYLATEKIPVGCIYDFPHREAFEAWEERVDAAG